MPPGRFVYQLVWRRPLPVSVDAGPRGVEHGTPVRRVLPGAAQVQVGRLDTAPAAAGVQYRPVVGGLRLPCSSRRPCGAPIRFELAVQVDVPVPGRVQGVPPDEAWPVRPVHRVRRGRVDGGVVGLNRLSGPAWPFPTALNPPGRAGGPVPPRVGSQFLLLRGRLAHRSLFLRVRRFRCFPSPGPATAPVPAPTCGPGPSPRSSPFPPRERC